MTLTTKQATLFQDFADDNSIDLRKHYSGRCMYGKTCVGFVFSRDQDPVNLMMKLAQYLTLNDEEDMIDILWSKRDDMGLGTIVYFPDCDWFTDKDVEEEEEEEEEEEGEE